GRPPGHGPQPRRRGGSPRGRRDGGSGPVPSGGADRGRTLGAPAASAFRGAGARGGSVLTLEELTHEAHAGRIDTVVVAFTDMQGRLVGKRLHVEHFLEDSAPGEPVDGCSYLLARDLGVAARPRYSAAR